MAVPGRLKIYTAEGWKYAGFGSAGVPGASGYSGWSGLPGTVASSGYSGWSGLSGISGWSGQSGMSGWSGLSGWSGRSGYSGWSGLGYSGYSGYSGWSGANGSTGQNGASGYSGWSGLSGWSGAAGGGSGQAPVKYIVKNDSGTYKCYNDAGTVVNSGSVAKDVINYALNNLTSGRTWKEKIIIRGNIALTASIQMVDYAAIELQGKITLANSTNTFILYASGKSNIEISGGIWDGNQSNQSVPDECMALAFMTCSEVFIHDLEARYTAASPLYFADSHDIVIQNVNAHHSGIYANGSTWWHPCVMFCWCYNAIVSNSRVHDSSRGGIYFYTDETGNPGETNKQVIVKNCIVERTQCSGIELDCRQLTDYMLYGVCEGNICVDCGIDAEHPGIYVGWSNSDNKIFAESVTVTGNVVVQSGTNPYGQGIEVLGYGCTVVSNSVKNVYLNGITVFGEHNTVVGNTIRGVRNSLAAALALGDASQCTVMGNIIADCAGPGIQLTKVAITSNGCDSNDIIGNHIDNTAGNPILISDDISTDNFISENHITNPQAYFSFASTGNTIRGNVGEYYLSEKSGSAQFATNTATLVITHGLYSTPTKVHVTGTDSSTGSLWVTNITSSQFTINRASNSSTPTVYWRAEV